MHRRSVSVGVFVVMGSMSGCFSPDIDGNTTISFSGAPPTGTSGMVPGDDTMMVATMETTEATSMGTEGVDSTGLDCGNDDPPIITSSTDPIALMPGQTMVTVEVVFDREVTIESGGLTIDGPGVAMIASPSLPVTADSVSVVIESVESTQSYVLTVDGSAVLDACDRPMGDSVEIALEADCDGNTAPASTTAEFHQLPDGSVTDTYEVTFDEVVTLEAGAISVVGGTATIASITPALPAAANIFTVQLSNLSGVDQLQVDASLVSDACGSNLDQSFDLWVCSVSAVTFGYTGAPEPFTVPACAQGIVSLAVAGAQGSPAAGGGSGGQGGSATGNLVVTTGEILEVNVGGQDGYNGGGMPGMGAPSPSGTGGGASDVRQGGNTLAERVIVGGGGGGGAAGPQGSCADGVGGSGGAGGGTMGSTGTMGTGCGTTAGGGGGGTQGIGGAGGTSGQNCTLTPAPGGSGALGVGGDGSDATDCNGSGFTGGGGGGGGGGYYGGGGAGGGPGGGGGSWGGGGGGGGSSYTGGVNGGSTLSGTQSGDGQVTIDW